MIGIGKWTGELDTPLIKGSAVVTIAEKDGKYDFIISVPDVSNLPDFAVFDVKEDGDSLTGKAKLQLMGGITVDVFAEFHGDTFEGYIKIPFMGKIPISNGRRAD